MGFAFLRLVLNLLSRIWYENITHTIYSSLINSYINIFLIRSMNQRTSWSNWFTWEMSSSYIWKLYFDCSLTDSFANKYYSFSLYSNSSNESHDRHSIGAWKGKHLNFTYYTFCFVYHPHLFILLIMIHAWMNVRYLTTQSIKICINK